MFRHAYCLVAVLFLSIGTVGCQTEPLPEVASPAVANADIETQVLALLAVNTDGTVAITDETKMAALLGKSWAGAKGDLAFLNRRIRSGQLRPFQSKADLASYARSQPRYQPTLNDTGEVIFTEASDPPDPKNPQCREKCPPSELCCCGGFWVLCWSFCGCKP